MVFYISSTDFEEVIRKTIKELGANCTGKECSDSIYLLEFLHKNRNRMKKANKLIIDLNGVQDTEEEIVQALEMFRIEYHQIRIIVVVPSYRVGEDIIKKFMDMAIYDVIIADNPKDISSELRNCLTTGKQYKDALLLKQNIGPEIEKDIFDLIKKSTNAAINDVLTSDVFADIITDFKYCMMVGKQYKDVAKVTETTTVKRSLKRTANKILVGVAGAQARIGCSHLCIVIANNLRKKGYTVALLEHGDRGMFECIREANNKEINDEKYFTLNDIDYYPNIDVNDIQTLLANKPYNFFVVDFGLYQICDKLMYNKCDARMLVTGAKSWETESIGQIFETTDEETLKQITYVFNFVSRSAQEEIRKEMSGLNSLYFMPLAEDPFESCYIGAMEEIFDSFEQTSVEKRKRFKIKELLRRCGIGEQYS